MILWRFKCYVSPRGRNDVQQAIDAYDVYGMNRFERALRHLAVTPMLQWDVPHGRKLKNESELYEIRYQAFNRQERAIGCFLAQHRIFCILLICYHKGKIYDPPQAIKTARSRAESIRCGDAGLALIKIDGEDFEADEGP